ncbi:nucleotide exchange factor GrpE [Clostridium bornimense]|uniref:nucleotide exchange factor GrpE n=1 Tax=Clostridium bornimense TaxID=1216932 RepID=UPI001C119677|nr:nucleotide exchange factor GrpE [uncultured Clostridium sp.]MBU5316466.1 nucleotide exchange factor GrpE [Clostridium bornimense]
MEDSIRIKDVNDIKEELPKEDINENSIDNCKVLEEIIKLREEFNEKLKYDKHKEEMIDDLHNQLQQYKDNLVLKSYKPLVLDIISLIDSNNKKVDILKNQSINKLNSLKLLKNIEDFSEDLQDMLIRQGVEMFRSEGKVFDGLIHSPATTIETDDISRDKMIANTLKPGYILDDKVIKKEVVEVYSYKEVKGD